MKRRLRLRQSDDFARVKKRGQLVRHPLILLNYAPNEEKHNRYGFVTSKQIGKAVVRNRVKRRLREATRTLHPRLNQGYDIVIIARPQLVGQPFLSLSRILNELYRRASLLEDE